MVLNTSEHVCNCSSKQHVKKVTTLLCSDRFCNSTHEKDNISDRVTTIAPQLVQIKKSYIISVFWTPVTLDLQLLEAVSFSSFSKLLRCLCYVCFTSGSWTVRAPQWAISCASQDFLWAQNQFLLNRRFYCLNNTSVCEYTLIFFFFFLQK